MQQQKIPARVRQVAAEQRFGVLRTIYEAREDAWLYRILGLFAIIIGGVMMTLFVFAYATLLSWLPFWQSVLIPIIGAGWTLVGAWITITSLRRGMARVFMYDTGLIYLRPRLTVLRREEIEKVWKHVTINDRDIATRFYEVLRSDNTTLVFKNNIIRIKALGDLLEQEVISRYLSEAIEMYEAGKSVVFDIISIDSQGIHVQQKHENKLLAWRDIAHFTIKETTMSIYQRGEEQAWHTLPVAQIANIGVLKGLLDYIRRRYDYTPLPTAIATYKAGLPVSFGRLSIGVRGVNIDDGKKQFAWSEIASIGVGESEVIIRTRNTSQDWYILPLWMISDADVLKAFVDYVMQSR